MANLPKIALGAWGNDGTFGNNLTAESLKPIFDTAMENGLESHDFSGKTIVPFCTSGESGVGRSDEELHKNVKGDVKWKKGTQINRPDEIAIKRWLDGVL